MKGGRVLKYVTTLIGSEAGTTIPGKIIGALGGNLVGELIISSRISGPVKRMVLKNLETTNPEAYKKTIDWLKKQNIDRSNRLKLPAGKPVENPIVTPDPRQYNPDGTIKYSPAKSVTAQKNSLSMNPKTGKFQTTYNSQLKSPRDQQTIPAITADIKNPISNTISKLKNKVNSIPNKQGPVYNKNKK